MDNLIKGRLFYLLNNATPQELSQKSLAMAYMEFTDDLFNTIYSDEDFKVRYHRMATAIAEISALLERKKVNSKVFPDVVVEYVLKAESMLKSHFHLLNLEMKYCPQRSIKELQRLPQKIRRMKWGYSKRDLISVLTALDELGAIQDPTTSRKIPFKTVVQTISELLSVDLKNAYEIRKELLSRKIKVTSFLDSMTQALLKRSQK